MYELTWVCSFLRAGGVALVSVSDDIVLSSNGVSLELAKSLPLSLGSVPSPACLKTRYIHDKHYSSWKTHMIFGCDSTPCTLTLKCIVMTFISTKNIEMENKNCKGNMRTFECKGY